MKAEKPSHGSDQPRQYQAKQPNNGIHSQESTLLKASKTQVDNTPPRNLNERSNRFYHDSKVRSQQSDSMYGTPATTKERKTSKN